MSGKRTTWKGLKKGQKFKVVDKFGSNNYPLETVYTMKKDGENVKEMNNVAAEFKGGNYLNVQSIELLPPYTVSQMEEEINRINTEGRAKLKALQEKIEICNELGIEEYTPEVVQAAKIAKLYKKEFSPKKTAKELLKILKNEDS